MAEPVLLKGAPVAQRIREEAAAGARTLAAAGRPPRLLAVLDPAAPDARFYANAQRKACEAAGIGFAERPYPAGAAALAALVLDLNRDPAVTGVFLHTPAPAGVDLAAARELLLPAKDVEGIHPMNLGRLAGGSPGVVPCTAEAAVELLRASGLPFPGADVVVVGRSPTVGRPAALLLLAEKPGPTVFVCHSGTRDLADHCRRADALIVAIGRAEFLRADAVREGAVVIDVGTNLVKASDGSERWVGDVAFAEVAPKARVITPVPGGVGPVTTACLLRNVVRGAQALARS